jgi:hypothetical protein
MPNRRLTASELVQANALLEEIRLKLASMSGGDTALLWAIRRKVYKELTYDERGKPMHRRRLKAAKRRAQNGNCAVCGNPLPARHAVLDRLQAMGGYTTDNTRLICRECDIEVQRARGFTDLA